MTLVQNSSTRFFTALDADLHSNAENMTARRERFSAGLVLAFFFYAIVGLQPFADRNTDELTSIDAGGPNFLKQALSIFFFAASFWFFRPADQARLRKLVPLSVLLMLLLTVSSSFWSLLPQQTFRKAIALLVSTLSVFLCVREVGPRRAIELMAICLGVVAIVDLVSVFLSKNAVHGVTNIDPYAVIGNWRGMFFHKNVAGCVTLLSFPFLLYAVLTLQNRKFWFCLVAAGIFIIGAQSKTALGIVGPSILLYLVLHVGQNTIWTGRLFRFLVMLAALLIFGGLVIWREELMLLIRRGDLFTDRGAIWALCLDYAAQNLWFGSGYGAFWRIGSNTPALHLTDVNWLRIIAQTHNGFIELLTNLGIPGLVLATWAAFVTPLRTGLKHLQKPEAIVAVVVILTSFVLNITESRIFQTAREEWVIHLVALAICWELFKSEKRDATAIKRNDS